MIKVENIHGKLLLIGAKDDVLWDTAKYIRRMEERLNQKALSCNYEVAIYEHGTHFVFPEGMIKQMIPIGSSLLIKLCFKAAKQYPKECRETRMDIDKRVSNAIFEWRC